MMQGQTKRLVLTGCRSSRVASIFCPEFVWHRQGPAEQVHPSPKTTIEQRRPGNRICWMLDNMCQGGAGV